MTAASPSPSADTSRAFLLILVACAALNPLAINMFVPAMPEIRRSLDTDVATIQLVLSAYLFATAGAQLVLGPLSDRLGRRPVLIGGLLLYIVAAVICTLAPTIGILIFGRILQGIGGCAGLVLGRAIVRDRYERDRAAQMLGYITMGYAVAPMLGPVVGGMLNDLIGWRSIFGLQILLGIGVAVATIIVLPETLKRSAGEARPGLLEGFAVLSRIPAFWAFTTTLALETSVFFAFLGGTPYIAIEMLGMTGTEYGLHFMLVPGGYVLGNFVTGRYSRRFGIHRMIVAGCVVCLAAPIVMGLAFAVGFIHPLALFLPVYAVGFGNGLTIANASAGVISVRPQYAGAASGLAGSLQIGFGAVVTVVIGALLLVHPSAFTLVAVMLVTAGGGLACGLWTRTARS